MNPLIQIREFKGVDLDFVTSTWLKNYRSNNLEAGTTPKNIYFKMHHRKIQEFFGRKSSVVLMASDKQSPDHVFGYLCAEKTNVHDLIHYVYIKSTFRKMGVATSLLNHFLSSGMGKKRCAVVYTHRKVLSKSDKHQPERINRKYEVNIPPIHTKLNRFYEEVIYNPYLF